MKKETDSIKDLINIDEDGDGLENPCPVCGALEFEHCSIPDKEQPSLGIELTRMIHNARKLN